MSDARSFLDQGAEMDIVPNEVPASERVMKIDTMTREQFEEMREMLLGMMTAREKWTGAPPSVHGDDECDLFLRGKFPKVYDEWTFSYMQIRDGRISRADLEHMLDQVGRIVDGAPAGNKDARRQVYSNAVANVDWYHFAKSVPKEKFFEALSAAAREDPSVVALARAAYLRAHGE